MITHNGFDSGDKLCKVREDPFVSVKSWRGGCGFESRRGFLLSAQVKTSTFLVCDEVKESDEMWCGIAAGREVRDGEEAEYIYNRDIAPSCVSIASCVSEV